ncbi:MAG: lipopolysaccharide biosynthesis protein, partial [Tannerellaceae bacterium]
MTVVKNTVFNGLAWSSIETFSSQGIQFIISIIIARLIAPKEYGLIAMLSIFLAVAQIFIDSGFSKALIQKKNRTEADFSTIFAFNIFISVICYLLLYFSAPLIAKFYEQPDLTSVTRVVGIALIINALGIIQRSKFAIAFDFRTTAFISLISLIFSGCIGIILAYKSFGVWALVTQSLVSAFISCILLWILSDWKPSLLIDICSFKELFSFGSKLLISSLLHAVYINLYTLVIGRKYSATDLGYYNRANTLSQYPSVTIMMLIVKVLYPAQCEIQDDSNQLNRSFIQYLRISCFIIFPLTVGLAAVAYPLIELMLTTKWLPAAPLLQIMCIAYMWYPVMLVNNNILNVKGRSDYFLKSEIIKKIIAIAILLVTMPLGLRWLCLGILVYNILDMFIIIYFSKKVIDTGYLKQLREILPMVIASFVMGVSILLVIPLFSLI